MKILLDLQGCQSAGSRNRGIGRYSMALARTLVRTGPQHEFHVLLNGAFPDTIPLVQASLDALVTPGRIHVFGVPPECGDVSSPPAWRTRAAEAIRRAAIRQVEPDLVHVGSLFEGLVDDCAVEIDPARDGVPTAVTVYDFIPYAHADRYLAGAQARAWYMRKLESMRRAALLLGISASACREAESVLPERAGRVVNASTAADPGLFHPAPPGNAAQRHGLSRPFIMYTGGIDWRKNIEGLVAAFADLPRALRERHQLAIVCHAGTYARTQLVETIRKAGLQPSDVVITGFVEDEDLADLYRSCELFVFPSLHEGFGLPALEAMMCGAPVIGSNTSSIPEVIGREDALFDPRTTASITAAMRRALEDAGFRASLKAHAPAQAARFSWERTARTVLEAFEALHESRRPAARAVPARPRLALHAPLPPTRSGIADYTCELLPYLREHYDIELVHDQRQVQMPPHLRDLPLRSLREFRERAGSYDRVLYQFGNSVHHAHMFELLRTFPGAVVLHDFYLSSALYWMDTLGLAPGTFRKALMRSHGAQALAFEKAKGRDAAMIEFPCSRFVIERATGVIVHSRHALEAARHWYGIAAAAPWRVVPHLRVLPPIPDRDGARAALGIAADEFLVCSFGHLGPAKLNDRLLRAWHTSTLARNARCRLVLVGENTRPPYGDEVMRLVQAAPIPAKVAVTGYADRATYERYLAAADVAVQLRGTSRGETSGAVLDCLAHGVPLVANANGGIAEYPPDVMCRLADDFRDEELVAALEQLRADPDARDRLRRAARAHVAAHHDPARIAAQYRDAVEAFSVRPQHAAYWGAVEEIAALGAASEGELADAAVALEATWRPARDRARDTPGPSPAP